MIIPPSTSHETDSLVSYVLPGLIIWDPLHQLKCFSSGLTCTKCDSYVKPRGWKDGRSDHDKPRELFDIDRKVYLVSRIYVCPSDHRNIAHDSNILKRINPHANLIPFLLSHKVGITISLQELISCHIDSGLRVAQIEQLLVQLHWNRHSRMLNSYTNEVASRNNEKAITEMPGFDEETFPGRKLITLCFVGDYAQKEQLYATRMCMHPARWVSCDHTFKVVANVGLWKDNKWITQYDTLFVVCNEDGVVVTWQLCKGTSFSKVKHLLQQLQRRLEKKSPPQLEAFHIDNCCQWRNQIQAVFGRDVLQCKA